MPITKDINTKSNVREKTDADLNSSIGQPVIAFYKAESTNGQTVVPATGTFPFAIDQNSKETFHLYLDGKLLTEGAANDYVFTGVDGNNFSSSVSLNAAIGGVVNIYAEKLGVKKDAELGVDTRIQGLYDADLAGFQGFIDTQDTIAVPNTVIVNRARIVNLANDLKAGFGPDRLQIQAMYELQNEFGANGERIYAAVGDDRGLVRFAGIWTNVNGTSGAYVTTSTNTDYAEVTFYGTGLNMLTSFAGGTYTYQAAVDGGAAATFFSQTASAALVTRNYGANQVIPVVSGLTLGVHTVKITATTASVSGLAVSGFEFLGGSTLKVNSGTAYLSGKKLVSSGTTVAATAAATGTKGGRMLTYVKADGTIGQSFTATNASQLNTTSADHTNEDVIRTFYPQEFGAGRADDFSMLPPSASGVRFFGMEDNTTFLSSTSLDQSNGGIIIAATSGFLDLTFVGTGLDITNVRGAVSASTYSFIVDNTTIASGLTGASLGTGGNGVIKVVSGLPYGTHTFRLLCTNLTGAGLALGKFIVYGPKKPTLPTGAVELADYFVVANFVANTVQSKLSISTGTIRRHMMRENAPVGTGWGLLGTDVNQLAIPLYRTTNNGDFTEFTFYGTGFDIRTAGASNGDAAAQLTLDGSTNFSGFTTSFYGTGIGFTAATGVWDQSGNDTAASGLCVTGLTLGVHKLRLTKTSGTYMYLDALDVVTPIHAPVNKQSYYQNTFMTGNCAISDSRKISPVKTEDPKKAWAQATAISGPSTTATVAVPMPDMNATIVMAKAGRIRITYSAFFSIGASATATFFIVLDGVQTGVICNPTSISGGTNSAHNCIEVPVGPGAHTVQIFWATNSSTMSAAAARSLLVEEV